MFANPVGGNASTPSWPQRFGTIQSVDLEITQKLVDLYGQNKFPDDVAPSDMKITGKSGFATIEIDIYNTLFYADTVTTGVSIVAADELHTIPGSTSGLSTAVIAVAGTGYTVGDIVTIAGGTGGTVKILTAPAGVPGSIEIINPGSGYTNTTGAATTGGTGTGLTITITVGVYTVTVIFAATWTTDLGVRYATTGQPLVRVGSGPTVGQYSEAAGVYTFAAADAAAGVLISYVYTNTAGRTLTVNNHIQGYGPLFELYLLEPYQGANGVHLYSCRSSKMSNPLKRDGYLISDFEFTAYANAAGKVIDFFQISA